MEKMDSIQLEMNFNGNDRNIFKNNLDNGTFQILTELSLPKADTPPAEAAARYADLEYLIMGRKEPAGIAFIDDAPDAVDPVLFASTLCQMDRDRHVIYLSGRNRTVQQIYEMVRVATGEGFKNFCAVSGTPVAGETAAQTSKRKFAESVHQLELLNEEYQGKLTVGCTVNPYKYTAPDLCLQYYKLVKKINTGASFAVSQYGWDMMKQQEMLWYMTQCSLHIPAIARVLFLTPEKAEDICAGKVPGVHISPDLEQVLKNEMQYSRMQFEAAQLRRIQIHTAGLRLLGYSGIQLAGIDSTDRLQVILDRIAEAEQEFKDFETWQCAYNEYYEKLDMAPYPYKFYLYENLLSAAQPPVDLNINNAVIPEPTSSERTRYNLGKFLFAHAAELPASERKLTKKLLFSCKSCNRCRLPETFYVCPETCPLHLANGPCGASRANGSCRFNAKKECIYLKQMRLVNDLREYSALEERIVPDNGK